MGSNMQQKLMAAVALAALAACARETGGADASEASADAATLKAPAAFETIADETQRSQALFAEMFKVISSPRCLNCHPAGDSPLQGDMMTAHYPPVTRGPDGGGAPGMECTTCHGPDNVAYLVGEGSVPGHGIWALAPIEMAWVGFDAGEVCAQLKDEERNGGRDLEAIHYHHAEDGLVGWGWHPGEGRTPAPGDQETFGALTLAWVETGAHCPS